MSHFETRERNAGLAPLGAIPAPSFLIAGVAGVALCGVAAACRPLGGNGVRT